MARFESRCVAIGLLSIRVLGTNQETIVKFARTTRTTTGLQVKAYLVEKKYDHGVKISDDQMGQLCIREYKTLPKWNYTLRPGKNVK